MTERFVTAAAEGVEVCLDLAAGHIRGFSVERGGRSVAPLHTAPWVDDPEIQADEDLPGNLRALSGDFFCAPFSTSDIDPAPLHGWPANTAWSLVEHRRETDGAEEGTSLVARLDRPVMGAELTKILTVRPGHPVLYERHVFQGGSGALPVANHAMVSVPAGARLSFSPKSGIETPARPLEPDPARGRFALAYPARTDDPTRVPLANGEVTDLGRYPIAERSEDFAILIEARTGTLGWFAVLRPESRDVLISLKSPRDYPITMLWFSNGGRDYRPWNGRHTGVLGVEEGRSYAGNGHRASIEPNAYTDAGLATALTLDPEGEVEVRNALVALPVPAEWTRIAEVTARDGRLTLTDEGGSTLSVPFDTEFLAPR